MVLRDLRYFTSFMHIREGEQILKVYHHHPTPFVFEILKVIAGTFPFLLLLFFFKNVLPSWWYFISYLIILGVFILVITYVSLIYWLDKLIITNHRIVYQNWKYLTARTESEVEMHEIADIQTYEKGFLAHFKIFDYGLFKLDTPSSYVALEFPDAPNPEEIRRYIYHVRHP